MYAPQNFPGVVVGEIRTVLHSRKDHVTRRRGEFTRKRELFVLKKTATRGETAQSGLEVDTRRRLRDMIPRNSYNAATHNEIRHPVPTSGMSHTPGS